MYQVLKHNPMLTGKNVPQKSIGWGISVILYLLQNEQTTSITHLMDKHNGSDMIWEAALIDWN